MIKRIQLVPLTILWRLLLRLNTIRSLRLLNMPQVIRYVPLNDVCSKLEVLKVIAIVCEKGIEVEQMLTFFSLDNGTHGPINLRLWLLIAVV